jgi:3-oxoacyl-[acyl-carrier-protein] synthase-3
MEDLHYNKYTMAIIKYKNVAISAISACVPKNVSSNHELSSMMPEEEVEKVINSIGIKEKRIADKDVCASDLCFKAAEKLLDDNQTDKAEIDALIFVSQTPDFRQPATAMFLQNRLGLSKSTLCFDINLACSGYVYGLSVAFAYASCEGIRKVLLLVGETMSKTISAKDKITAPLFGDAGTATLISKKDGAETSLFSLNSDGSESDILRVPYGGYRQPSSLEGLKEYTDDAGNIRTGEHLNMKGMEVFNFGLREVPKDIKKVIAEANKSIDEIDVFVFHQANKFMTDFFAKKLKINLKKVPYSLSRFGNTSSASIPLAIVSEMCNKDAFHDRRQVILSGFGAGLSWATALINLEDTNISELIEYK